MAKIPAKQMVPAFFPGLLTCIGCAFIFTIIYAVANIWLDGHNYNWHQQRFRFGIIDMGVFDILILFFSSAAGIMTGICFIRSRKDR